MIILLLVVKKIKTLSNLKNNTFFISIYIQPKENKLTNTT